MMQHARYVGKREDLLGRTALIRRGNEDGEVLAQFDFPVNFGTGDGEGPEPPECTHWHSFSRDDFKPTEELLNEVTPL